MKFIYLLLIALTVTACHTSYKIRREKNDLSVKIDCISSAISKVDGVKFERTGTGGIFTCDSGQHSNEYIYIIEDLGVGVQVITCTQQGEIKKFYQQSVGMMNGTIRALTPTVLEKMKVVEAAIGKSCGIEDFSQGIKAECELVDCQ